MQKKEEAAAALLDLAGVEKGELQLHQSMVEIVVMGTELRRRGSQFIIVMDAEMKKRTFFEVKHCLLARLRSLATEASSSSDAQSELMRITRYVGVQSLSIDFVSMGEKMALMQGCLQSAAPEYVVPSSWIPGSAPHIPGCDCK